MIYAPSSIRQAFFLFLSLGMLTVLGNAQSTSTTYVMAKGEVLDLLLISQRPNTDSLLKEYFKQAFPVAERYGYKRLPGFKVTSPVIDGTRQPQFAIFGGWPSVEARSEAYTQLEAEVEGFHQMRRDLWSDFLVSYWTMDRETRFTLNREDYNVVTALWSDDELSDAQLETRVRAHLGEQGTVVQVMHNGQAPARYRYAPRVLVFSSWPSEAAFQTAVEPIDSEGLLDIHEFAIY